MDKFRDWMKKSNMRFFTNLGFENTVFKLVNTEEGEVIKVNFEPNRFRSSIPDYAGAYFKNEQKAIKIAQDGIIQFSAYSPDGRISSIYVEVKPFDLAKHNYHESFRKELTTEKQLFEINVSDFIHDDIHNYIGEITFVLKTDCFIDDENLTGELVIDNLDIINTEIDFYNEIDDLTNIKNTLNEMQTDIKEILSITQKISNYMQTELKDLLYGQRLELEKTASGGSPSDEQIAHMCEYCANRINEKIRVLGEDIQSENMQRQQKELKEMFGEIWDYLIPSSKLSLISAKSMWETCKSISFDFDYSGIVICATCALENELKDIFCYSFNHYLQSNTSYSLVNYEKYFTLGSVQAIINDINGNKVHIVDNNNKVSLIVAKNLWDAYFEAIKNESLNLARIDSVVSKIDLFSNNDYGKAVAEKIESIRVLYRNPAGHSTYIDRRTAEDCYNQIIGKSEAETIIERTPTVIKELYTIIDIKKLQNCNLEKISGN